MEMKIRSGKLHRFSLKVAFMPFVLLLVTPWAQLALAEDVDPALPPPTEMQDTPAAHETVVPKHSKSGNNLTSEFSGLESPSNGEIYSYKRNDGTKIEEYSRRGHVYMVKVSPPGGLPPYYLYDQNGDGQFHRDLNLGGKRITPPEWVIKRF